MSGDRYKIQDQQACYFITMTVVYWIDVFSRKVYRDIIVDALNYCTKEKGLKLNAWVIMSNHVHFVGSVTNSLGMSGFLRDFKKYTSKRIIEAMNNNTESGMVWLLDKFAFEARRTGRAENYKLWKDDNHAICLSDIDAMNKIDYVHNNPVAEGIVVEPDHYIYSSAIDYAKKRSGKVGGGIVSCFKNPRCKRGLEKVSYFKISFIESINLSQGLLALLVKSRY